MLYSTNFLSLDGVMSHPEKWHPPYASDESGAILAEHLDSADAMLIGRRTYEEFAAHWPSQDDSVPIARRMNQIHKYVVSGSRSSFDWANTQGVGGDLVGAVDAVRRANDEVIVPGGAMLIRGLLDEGLIDEMRFYLDPIVVGEGERLFGGSSRQRSFELVDERSLPKGVRYLAYRPL
jgi:dihydrofolate reductase